jgi:hypothetical protein
MGDLSTVEYFFVPLRNRAEGEEEEELFEINRKAYFTCYF